MTNRIPLEPPANERLGGIACPVLAVAAELDIADCMATAWRLAGAVPDGRVEVVPGVAHLVGLEAPERLTTLIVDFLAEADAP
jgi:pimeloyl-ACP methyl ester carboxylesterase